MSAFDVSLIAHSVYILHINFWAYAISKYQEMSRANCVLKPQIVRIYIA